MPTVELIHLSGERRGQTDVLRSLPAALGADGGADVRVPGAAERHALVACEQGELLLRDLESGRGTFLAGERVSAAPLRDGDVIELGGGGPRLRVRRLDGRHAPFLRALWWRRPEGAPRHARDAAALLRAVLREGGLRTRPAVRLFALLGLVLALGLAVWSRLEGRRLQQEVASLRQTLRAAEERRTGFERRVEAERQRSEVQRRRVLERQRESRRRADALSRQLQDAAAGEVRAVRAELEATRARLAALESERAAAERVITRYGAGVALVQGAYAFYDAEARPLRLRDADGKARGEEGAVRVAVDGEGPVHTVAYFGTAFVVSPDGRLLTNRHVAEPWWKDETAEALAKRGYHPRFVLFRAFFPGRREPFELDVERVAAGVDLALLRFEPRGARLPVLPLDHSGRGAVAGHAVIVVGYPAGLEAIMAKADAQVVAAILDAHGTGAERVTEALSERGLIRPSSTQGHIGDITASDIVFDAPSSQGGSGAPVFNKDGLVIGVEYAVLTTFGGNSFAVPLRAAGELLRPRRESPPSD